MLRLEALRIQQEDSSVSDSSYRSKNTCIDVPDIGLDPKESKKLKTLRITLSAKVVIIDITQCRSLINLTLIGVRVQSVYMLQTAISSFTQLMNLNLGYLLFSDKKENMHLNLAACTHLTKLDIENIHVEHVEINPSSLQELIINHVSGSMRCLLLALPNCQNLTCLYMDSLYDKKNAELMINLFPILTTLKSITCKIDMCMCYEYFKGDVLCRAAVAQAETKMIGLEELTLLDIDMGAMALTLSPSMTRIKNVKLEEVQMKASSWFVFITSLLNIQQGFDVNLSRTNIDDDSVSFLHSSPDFNVTVD